MRKVDVIVLGAGMVGLSIALHLALRGRTVAVVDRWEAENASSGGAGIIAADAYWPVPLPAGPVDLALAALWRRPHLRLDWRSLPGSLLWFSKRWRSQHRRAFSVAAKALAPLVAAAAREHRVLAEEANADRYVHAGGAAKLYRSDAGLAAAEPALHFARIFGVAYDVYDVDAFLRLEPHLRPLFRHAVLWRDSQFVIAPGALVEAYARLLRDIGGRIETGDATSLAGARGNWTVSVVGGELGAAEAVVALGAQAPDLLTSLGYRFPFAVERGYHRDFRVSKGGAVLTRPVTDVESGFTLAPTVGGLRLTTGIDFTSIAAPPAAALIARAEQDAKRLFPLEEPKAAVWAGARLTLPDGLPIIGRAPLHGGLWLSVGHGDIGFGLGPAAGRLLAELITGAEPFAEAEAFAADRFMTARI